MNWQPPTTTPDPTEPVAEAATTAELAPSAEESTEPEDAAPIEASVSEITADDPLLEAPPAPVAEAMGQHSTDSEPVSQVDSVVETLMSDDPTAMIGEPAPTPEAMDSPSSGTTLPPGTVHIFEPASRRPIDKFIASCFNDIGRLVGAHINSGRRGTHITLTGITPTGVQRATPKGDTTEIPLPALEWAIKQLYWNGELTRSKMTESYKENGSTVASGVFQILGNCKWFEATETPLTLHFYRLQWEEENAD